jgi:hypothetical protein
MRKRYFLPMLTFEEKLLFEYLLLGEVEKQRWYAIVHLDLWKSEGIISVQ